MIANSAPLRRIWFKSYRLAFRTRSIEHGDFHQLMILASCRQVMQPSLHLHGQDLSY